MVLLVQQRLPYQQKVQASIVVQSMRPSQLVFSTQWNFKEVGSDASKGIGFPKESENYQVERERKREKESERFLLLGPYIGCQQKTRPRLKVDLHTTKDPS